jgi:hypothetical protein
LSDQTEPAPAPEPLDPLDMAGNLVAAVEQLARYAADDPLQAHVHQAGARQAANGELASQLALVSIARDLRRIADHLDWLERGRP